MSDAALERQLKAPDGYRLDNTYRSLAMGQFDPSMRTSREQVEIASWTPHGPVSVRAVHSGDTLSVSAWGDGAEYAIELADRWLGLNDQPDAFQPPAGPVRDLQRRFGGMHFSSALSVSLRAIQIVLFQLVTYHEAVRTWNDLVTRHGSPASGPVKLVQPPTEHQIRGLSVDDLVYAGLTHKRARTIKAIATNAAAIDRDADKAPQAALRRLATLPGFGPWSLGYLDGTVFQNPDAVLLGDYHLPRMVAWHLIREQKADDARMLELLEPYAGHRFRVVRLIWASGEIQPRRGPRMTPRARLSFRDV
ncbi:MAG: DNA-3-methyladenine glycosylase family protein [Gammaproteobacteria bacterium]